MTTFADTSVLDLRPGDFVRIYEDVTVEVLDVERVAGGVRVTWRQHGYIDGGQIDGSFVFSEHRRVARLDTQTTATSHAGQVAAERAADTAQNGA